MRILAACAAAQDLPHLPQALVLEVAQHDGGPVLRCQFAHRVFQQGRDTRPDLVAIGSGFLCLRHKGLRLLFAAGAAAFGPEIIPGGSPCGFVEPSAEGLVAEQPVRLAGQESEEA